MSDQSIRPGDVTNLRQRLSITRWQLVYAGWTLTLPAFAQREGSFYRVLGTASTLPILFLSTFVILEVVDLIFGEHVELGSFVDVLLLIVAQRAMVLVGT